MSGRRTGGHTVVLYHARPPLATIFRVIAQRQKCTSSAQNEIDILNQPDYNKHDEDDTTVHQRLSKAENPGSCRLPGFSIPFLDHGTSRRRGLSSPQAGGLPIIFCFFCYPAICRCNTRSHQPKPKGQKTRRHPRRSPPSIAKESATKPVYQISLDSTRFARKCAVGLACGAFARFASGALAALLCPFHGESLDFSSDFLPLVHRFLFFLAGKYGIIP